MRSTLAIWIAFGTAAFGQFSSTVGLSNGVRLEILTQPEPSAASGLKAEMEPASGNSVYRIYRDENNLVVFVYELAVEQTSDGKQFRVTARAAGDEFAARFPNADAGKPAPTLSAPIGSPLLNSGERFSIDIPTDPGLQLAIADVVRIQLNQRGTGPETGAQSSAQLRFAALRVRAEGRLLSSGAAGAIVAGRYVMFYVPGRGGYFFSTEPVSGPVFAHIGIVEGSKLKFTLDNQDYECESEDAILLKSERGQIWVYHDRNYRPAGNWTKSDPSEGSRDQFFTAASDSLHWWVR
ncbi:MAG TPA: hypothetical protein VLW25_05260 [Bryobacteraceae bacterium]|nr:hypothetical protein [Bryobacteraceae bacterium]